jgi:hypothetical protein
LKTGAFLSTRDLFLQVDNEKTQKNQRMHDQLLLLATIIAQCWRPVAYSGALDLLYWAMRAGIILAHCHGHQNGQQSRCMFLFLFYLLLPWQPLGRYGASSRPMAASSGFWGSPEHAALSNAACIAPMCLHSH